MGEGERPDWSRPPFPDANTMSVRHGADSVRVIGPAAETFEAEARGSDWWPEHLRSPLYARAVSAWAWAECQVDALRRYLGGMDLADALTEHADEQTDETRARGSTRRMTHSRRTSAAIDRLRVAERDAARSRAELGLNPVAAAKLAKDLAQTGYTRTLTGLAALQEGGSQLVQDARRRGVLGDGSLVEIEASTDVASPEEGTE